MGWGGSVLAMITSLRNNKNLLSKRKSLYDKDKLKNINYTISEGLNCDIEATEEQLLEIRTRIQKRNKRKRIIFSTTAITSVLIALFFVFYYSKNEVLATTHKAKTEKTTQIYQNYIKYGDTWLEDRKWKAAIHNYQKAVELAPNDYHSQYRLALAFAYHCAYENANCEEGNQLLNELITKFGSNSDIEYLKGIIVNR